MHFSSGRLGLAFSLILPLLSAPAAADWFGEGRSKIGVEFELEKGPGNAWRSQSLTLVPGIKLEGGWIDMVELLVEGARESDRQTGTHADERKIGVRLRHEFPLTDDAKIVLRELLGHASIGDERFFHYYVEPSFRYALGDVEMMIGYRFARGINASKEHDLHKLRLGPSIDLSEHSEIEFRWVRAWNQHTGHFVSDSYIVEYSHKF